MSAAQPDGRAGMGQPGDAGADWDDARLASAFAARSASTPPTPDDVAAEVLARLDQPPRGLRAWPTFAVAAAAVALVLVLGGSTILRQAQPSPPAGNGSASSQPTETPDLPNPVLAAIGDPITVSAALAIRGSDAPDREIQVAGFLSPLFALPCPMNLETSNPTHIRCPESFQFLMEQAEPLATMPTSGLELRPPTGPAFHPSFALVEPPLPPASGDGGQAPVPVVLLGHFHDRRAALCIAADRPDCEQAFIVDRVISVDAVEKGVATTKRTATSPTDLEQDVDALVLGAAPGAIIESRRLVPVGEVIPLEPVLSNDQVIPYIADKSTPFWIVTVVDLQDGGLPVARTFVLWDASNWFAEITAAGAQALERSAHSPSASAPPEVTSADPTAFDSAPASVLGIPVRDIASLQRDRQAAMDVLGRDEQAIRAWYLAPDPTTTCDEQPPALHAPLPPCDEARHWLLDDPQQYGMEDGQLRRDPSTDHYPPVLNPLLPVDVAFDVGSTWDGETPIPRPVIVLGHFEDNRVDTYAGNLYFVIDALAWTPGRAVTSFDSVVRLTPNATEDVSSVLARIAAVSPKDAVATWATVGDAADFRLLDPRSESMPEFTTGAPVWMVARLVHDETDGRQRIAVIWAFTADGGDRVWAGECPDCAPDLATTIDIHDLDPSTPLVRIFDYDAVVTSAGKAADIGGLSWRQPKGNATDDLDVARGRTAREVVIRWFSPSCPDITMNIDVHDFRHDDGFYFSVFTRNATCEGADRVAHRILLEFDHPIDIDKIEGPSCCG